MGRFRMTQKRFKADKYYEVWDNEEFLLSFDQTVDLLNELNDTNEYLKQSLKRQQSSNKECSKYIEEVQKENEELKKELNAFKPVMFQDMRKGTVILYRKGDVE